MKKLHLLALLMLGCLTQPALALTCTTTVDSIALGIVDPLSTSNPLAQSSGNVSVTCTRSATDTLTNISVTACLSIGTGSGGRTGTQRTLDSSGNKLNFNLFKDAAGTDLLGVESIPIGTSLRMFFPAASFTGLVTSTATQNALIYARVNSSQSSAVVGSYQSRFASSLSFGYLFYASGNQTCNQTGSTATIDFTVTASIVARCTISATNLNFGSASNLSTQIDQTSTLSVSCTNAAPYSVALGNGSNYSGSSRRMKSGSNFVTYSLFRNAGRTQAWSSGTGNEVTGTGTGVNQNLTVYGRVPTQANPPAGSYADTVAATITF